MTTDLYLPGEVVGQVMQTLGPLPACVAGSVVAAETYNLPCGEHADIDVFCYTIEALVAGVTRLLHAGYTLAERSERAWERWLRYGINHWHTNSIKLIDPVTDVEVNLVHKSVNRSPLTTLSQVLESFDFGLLASGYDLQLGVKQDLRSYLFPDYDINGPLPLMPARRTDWRGGFISQYQGLRELGRYAKYCRYGHDLSLVKDDLIEGYRAAALYLSQRDSQEKLNLSTIYYAAADRIEVDDLDQLEEAAKLMTTSDSLDAIMEAIE